MRLVRIIGQDAVGAGGSVSRSGPAVGLAVLVIVALGVMMLRMLGEKVKSRSGAETRFCKLQSPLLLKHRCYALTNSTLLTWQMR